MTTMEIPRTYREARESTAWENWEEAIERELFSMRDKKTYELVPIPKEAHLLPSKWVLKNIIAF
jgi:hypothetical protein